MTPNVQEIEAAMTQLTPEQLSDFRTWFTEFEAKAWDQQLASDVTAGRLDTLADEALLDYRTGRTRPL